MQSIETIIVGGGQAGLSTSYFLSRAGREHQVLEQAAKAADAWDSGRWDSFSLVTPNWSFRLPGAEYDGPEPDGFMGRNEILARFERYVDQFQLPVQTRTRVAAIEAGAEGYRVSTSSGDFVARNVVIATGLEQLPKVPKDAAAIAGDIVQLHSSAYRNPDALPPGAVLVVGSAQSGAQIVEEIYRSGRQVYHAIGSTGRAPRRYRGKDLVDWLLNDIGFFDLPPERFPVPIEQFSPPHVSGANGGHSLNLHQFTRDGVRLLGHFQAADGTRVRFKPDLYECLERADYFEQNLLAMIDSHIARSGIEAPLEELPRLRDGFEQPVREQIDLRAEGVTSIVWATGYRFDFGMVKVPVFDRDGFPLQSSGVTDQPGLFFVGMLWMPAIRSGTLFGVGDHARNIAEQIIARDMRRPHAHAA